MNEDATVNITAYVLQVNGAKAGTQELTRSTGDVLISFSSRGRISLDWPNPDDAS